LLIIHLIFWLLSFNAPDPNGCLKVDIILIGDLSGSVEGHEEFVVDAFDSFVNRFELSEYGIKIGAIVFSTGAVKLSGLTHNKTELIQAINTMRDIDLGQQTFLYRALLKARNEFNANGRKDVTSIIIIVSDGNVYEAYNTANFIEYLRYYEKTKICGIYIDDNDGIEEYMIFISDPDCYVSSSYNVLVQTLEQLDICL
jgi:hypothetical protein